MHTPISPPHETHPFIGANSHVLPFELAASIEKADLHVGGSRGLRDRSSNLGRLLGSSAVILLAASLLQGSETASGSDASKAPVPAGTTNTRTHEKPIEDTLNTRQAQNEWKRFVNEVSVPLNPESFADGQHVGAFVIEYANKPNRPWGLIDAFYKKRGIQKPKMNNPMVHRMVAGMPTDKNLANGVVLDSRSTSDKMVAAMHDVTPIKAAEAIDVSLGNKQIKGVYTQKQMGINAVLMPGDVVHIVQPTNREGWVVDHTYTMVGKYILHMYNNVHGKKVLNQQGIDHLFTKGNKQTRDGFFRIYQCWEPGSDQKRLVYELKPTGTNVYRGKVEPIGKATPAGANL